MCEFNVTDGSVDNSPEAWFSTWPMPGPVTRLTWTSGQNYVYAITSTSVVQVPIEQCSSFTDCLSCAANVNPLCGLCTVEQKCSWRLKCQNSTASARWSFGKDKPVYVGFIIALTVYNAMLCFYALYGKHFLEIIAFLIVNILTTLYASFEVWQFRPFGPNCTEWPVAGQLAIASVAVLFVFTAVFVPLALYMYCDFGWKVYKDVNCNHQMRTSVNFITTIIVFVIYFGFWCHQPGDKLVDHSLYVLSPTVKNNPSMMVRVMCYGRGKDTLHEQLKKATGTIFGCSVEKPQYHSFEVDEYSSSNSSV
eukprot:Em0014g322a